MIRRFTRFLLLTASASLLGAQELRTIVAGSLPIAAENAEGGRLSMGYADAVALTYPKESPFIQGFEIEVKSPAAAMSLPSGALAWELWQRVEPEPDRNRWTYTGERLLTQPLPARAGFVIQVPTRADHGLKTGPYATVYPLVVEAREFPVLFKLTANVKGISPELEAAQFQVSVKPLLTDEGGVRIVLRWPEGAERQAVNLGIDDRKVDQRYIDGKDFLVVKPGTHFLRLSSELYRDESRSFTVERGKIVEVVIELQDTTPLLTIEAPDSAIVSLDGARIDHLQRPSFTVEPGEHTVSCRIGDYTVQRKFSAFRGKTYRILLSVDLLVQEGP